jgi:hypothetical protein
MCFKPTGADGHAKLERWQREREERGEERPAPPQQDIRPRGNQDTDQGDLERSVERLEALVGH